jgi:hypothetical protein
MEPLILFFAFILAFLFLGMVWTAGKGAILYADFTGVGMVLFMVGFLVSWGLVMFLFSEDRELSCSELYTPTKVILKRLCMSVSVALIGFLLTIL